MGAPPDIDDLWRAATQLHGAGRLAEAAALYDRVLEAEPRFATAYGARAVARLSLGRPDLALDDFDRLLALEPGHAEAFSNRGVALTRLGRLDEALASYDRALLIRPGFAEAYNNRSDALGRMGRPAEALASADAALLINPDWAAALNNRGTALGALGRQADALVAYRAAAACDPAFADAHFNAGVALMILERPREALVSFDAALAVTPDLFEAHYNRGNALYALKEFEAAAASCQAALRLAPRFAPAWHNLGKSLQKLRRFEDSLAAYQQARALKPDQVESHINAGFVLMVLGRLDEAMAAYDQAIALKPDPVVENNRALNQLTRGDFAQGWRTMEQRKAMPEWAGAKDCPGPEWLGQADIAGKTLFVHWEQGLGDTIQFCRLLNQVQARGAQVIFSCQDALHALISTLDPPVELIGEKSAPERYDFQTALMSLPLALGVTEATIPARPSYLRPDPELAEKWRSRLGDHGFKVGIAWRGSAFGARRGYSFELSDLEPLAQIPGVRLISLQKLTGPPPEAPMPVEFLGSGFDAGPQAFADTAAVMQSLDLIVTPDTAIAHLAGALGRPVWVALHKSPDWRWLTDRQDSPWYPGMRLFRQTQIDDWSAVFADMARELNSLRQGG